MKRSQGVWRVVKDTTHTHTHTVHSGRREWLQVWWAGGRRVCGDGWQASAHTASLSSLWRWPVRYECWSWANYFFLSLSPLIRFFFIYLLRHVQYPAPRVCGEHIASQASFRPYCMTLRTFKIVFWQRWNCVEVDPKYTRVWGLARTSWLVS